jgi:hypothetical protein
MPHIACPRCHRANPGDAVFCWFDGFVLRQSAVAAGASPAALPQEFVFPSGRRCRTYDDLLAGCQAEWEEARSLLQDGEFSRYLARLGRMDLVRAAKEAQAQGDPDLALQNFLSSLPASQTAGAGPRLDLSPRRLMLGLLRVGELRQVRVTVSNKGTGVLQGKIRVSEGEEWLKIIPLTPSPLPSGAKGVADEREMQLKTARDQDVMLRVEPRGLPAGQTYSGKLTVVTNGGVAEAPVRLDLAAAPFSRPPFHGAASARELAERMRANPKPAGPLLESGDVARWFAANGWSYPVPGAPAHGVAAVQQFFECMGLSKPPPLELSQAEFHFQCEAPETARGQVTLRTPARKWVYAQAAGDKPWLRVTTPNVSGPQQTAISFEVDSGLMPDGPVQDCMLHITANASQRFEVRIRVEVRRPRGYRPPAPPPHPAPVAAPARAPQPATVAMAPRQAALQPPPPTITTGPFDFEREPVTAPPTRPRASYGGRLAKAIVAGAVLALLVRLFLLLPGDLYARLISRAVAGPSAAAAPAPPGGWDFWRLGPMTAAVGDKPSAIDPVFLGQFIFATWWLGGVAGLVLVWRAGGRATDVACGVVAGAAAGVVGAATAACLMVLFDGLPRLPLQILNATAGPSIASMSAWIATPLWIVLALGCWTFLGAAAGFALGMLGARGGRILTAAAAPLTWLLRTCGMGRAAVLFSLQ